MTTLSDPDLILLIEAYVQGSITGRKKAIELGVRKTRIETLANSTAKKFNQSGSLLSLTNWLDTTFKKEEDKPLSFAQEQDMLWGGKNANFFYTAFDNSFGQGKPYATSSFLEEKVLEDNIYLGATLKSKLQAKAPKTDELTYRNLLDLIKENYDTARAGTYDSTTPSIEDKLKSFTEIASGLGSKMKFDFDKDQDFFKQYDEHADEKFGNLTKAFVLSQTVKAYATILTIDPENEIANKAVRTGLARLYLASRDIAQMYAVSSADIK
jgi:hypothetical protein